MDLSILICSTHTRWRTFGQAIQKQIWEQYNQLAPGFQDAVEIIMVTDNKKMMLGAKRNAMVDIAQGRYVAFVDDDDRLEPDYLVSLLDAIARHPADVITFQVSVSLNGADPQLCVYSKNFRADRNLPDRYERLPNHLMCVRRELAAKVQFPHQAYGEDAGYAKQLQPLLESEHAIDRVLYHYDFFEATTETQTYRRNKQRPRAHQEPLIDVIILSNAATPELRQMTATTITTCEQTAEVPINIFVCEQNIRATKHGRGHYRVNGVFHMADEFNYNRFANRGAAAGRAPWILIANNDLRFQKGWDTELLAANHPLVSPKCPRDPRQQQFRENMLGDMTGRHFSGWCFMIKRTLWEQLGGLDECVSFWFSDDVVIQQAKTAGLQPMLVPSAQVEHLQSRTLRLQDNIDELTWGQLEIYEAKYGPHRLSRDPRYLRRKAHR